ncbi:MAG TPA: response regulator transcription factor [Chthoniobacterales bacterium]|jgi:DNA-binding NarL/FixJ family response regulator|nr:response regulator transcription factor [Chthoniobacterales bacterium]
MSATPLRILVADDHDIIRQGTCAVLERQPGWEICGLAANGREAVAQARELKPDIVVMDMTMPELNGVDAALQIKRQLPETEIVLLSAHQSEEVIRSAFKAGVKSFIFKTETHDLLVESVRALARHQVFLTSKVSQVLLADVADSDQAEGGKPLSAREREILQLIAEGKTNNEVAKALTITVRTAENHRASVMRKLGADSVADLVRYAIRNKLIEA